MKGIAIHGALLAVMLAVSYQTWTRDTTVRVSTGEVEIWDRKADDVTAVEFQTVRKDATTGATNERTVRVERRGTGADAYWWGIETKTDQKPKPAPKPDAGVPDAAVPGDAGVAKSDAGAPPKGDAGAPAVADAGAPKGDAGTPGDAAAATDAGVPVVADAGAPPPVGELETKTTKREFPIGDKFPVAGAPQPMTFAELLGNWASMHAVRALGTLTDQQKKDFGLDDSTTTFAVLLKDGTHTFVLGGKVTGSKERYAIAVDSNQAYILSGAMIDPLESGENALSPSAPNGFDTANIGRVVISAGGKTRQADRIAKGWGDGFTQKPDQTLANFVDNLEKLRAQSYEADLKVSDLTLVVGLTYSDKAQKQLGTLTLYKREKPADKPDGAAAMAPPAMGQPTTVTEYFVVSETTRVPAKVPTPVAERVEQDLATVFTP
ncbi:MAG: DUF4340 domain-containing protein [Deltaproteobacteria bacterium]|nr:DUF4340 domain-containing protein [Deltaproteobacteria bacterium]